MHLMYVWVLCFYRFQATDGWYQFCWGGAIKSVVEKLIISQNDVFSMILSCPER